MATREERAAFHSPLIFSIVLTRRSSSRMAVPFAYQKTEHILGTEPPGTPRSSPLAVYPPRDVFQTFLDLLPRKASSYARLV